MPFPRSSCCVPVMSVKKLLSLLSCGTVVLMFGFYLVSRGYSHVPDAVKNFGSKEAPEELSMADMDKIQEERRGMVKKFCDLLGQAPNYTEINPELLDHIMVDDQYRLLYCYVPKVACTNWKRVMLVLSGTVDSPDIPANMSHQGLIRTLNFYSTKEIQFRLENYMKFIFVRHPFERILSAYRNKFQQNYSVYFQTRFGRKIIKRFRSEASPESLEKGHDVSFREFIHYLIDPQTIEEGPLNEHWRPHYQLCHPCLIKYDIIGKYETLERDAKYVLDNAQVSNLVRFPTQPPKTKTSEVLEDYFKDIPEAYVFKLFQLYALDFAMFEYKYADFDKYLPKQQL